MAARRLLIVLGILFAISIAAAAVAPQRPITVSTESSTTTEAGSVAPGGGVIRQRLLASASSPPTVRAEVGDQLSLSVDADEPLEVEISEFGLIANASPAAPALFDLLLRNPGAVAITDTSTGDIVGRLLVRRSAS
jgi:hypothetical protein